MRTGCCFSLPSLQTAATTHSLVRGVANAPWLSHPRSSRLFPIFLMSESHTAGELTPEIERHLAGQAQQAKAHSYSPYSKFRVGAALLAKSGRIYSGCNVENASYGGCICAERTAFVKAVSEGEREFVAIFISSDLEDFISPCGMCRQFMVEFGKGLKVAASPAITLCFRPALVNRVTFGCPLGDRC
ncbi:cytidine deaminase-like protein [Polychytrium aggregatum]|uniref:cytidine deaminase-like protein n=1 Tax=Polychytrium aggregatum TaxID=110093 RepID=UPI0022FDB8ED|nr:cytidine deaminase-like protein [Polychytrium aggregatum]KAI9204964.1 cytidine deaminase-like protein [Polychytrium aggregatum]